MTQILFVVIIMFQFMAERLEIAKYSNASQVDIFFSLLNKSLPVSVGKSTPLISRHPAALGPRFGLAVLTELDKLNNSYKPVI